MRPAALLYFVLGIWLGGSVIMGAVVSYNFTGFEPHIVELGRQLDFLPRDPPPPMLAEFQRYHGLYFAGEALRLGLLCLATLLVLARAVRPRGD